MGRECLCSLEFSVYAFKRRRTNGWFGSGLVGERNIIYFLYGGMVSHVLNADKGKGDAKWHIFVSLIP